MTRRTLLACLALTLIGPAARAQVPHARTMVPTRTALGRLGLERHWAAPVPLQFGTERVISINTAGQGMNEYQPAAVHDAPATPGRFQSDSDLSAEDDYYNGATLVFTGGALKDQERDVTGYRGRTHTFSFRAPFPEAPANGDPFEIRGFAEKIGGKVYALPASGAGFTTDATLSDRDDYYIGSTLVFLTGELKGQARRVATYDGKHRLFTFNEPFGSAPADGDSFRIRGGLLFAQTDQSNLHAFDAETGARLWTAQLGAPSRDARPAAVNSQQVFVTNSQDLYALDRETGRELWKIRLEKQPSSAVAAGEDLVMVGLATGKLVAFITHEVKPSAEDIFAGRPPGSFAWAWQANRTLTSRPIFADKLIAFASQDGKLYVAVREPASLLYRFRTGAPITASLGTFGTRTVMIPSEDNNLYAVDLFTADKRWVVPTGAPIRQEPLVARRGSNLEKRDVFVINTAGRLMSVDPDSGQVQWDIQAANAKLLAISRDRVYLENPYHDLFVVARANGAVLHSPRDSLERAGLNLRDYDLSLTNYVDDRLYFASDSGMILCLREAGRVLPFEVRDPRRPHFGYVPEEGEAVNPNAQPPAGEPPRPGAEPPGGDVPPQ